MKRIIGLTAAFALVLLQLGAVAAWSAEPPLDFSPDDHPARVAEQRV
jgi:hypothetical protein